MNIWQTERIAAGGDSLVTHAGSEFNFMTHCSSYVCDVNLCGSPCSLQGLIGGRSMTWTAAIERSSRAQLQPPEESVPMAAAKTTATAGSRGAHWSRMGKCCVFAAARGLANDSLAADRLQQGSCCLTLYSGLHACLHVCVSPSLADTVRK